MAGESAARPSSGNGVYLDGEKGTRRRGRGEETLNLFILFIIDRDRVLGPRPEVQYELRFPLGSLLANTG
jgi:hypothetical protein